MSCNRILTVAPANQGTIPNLRDAVVSKNSNDTIGDENACWSITHDGWSPVYSTEMSQPYRPLQLLLLMFAGWVNRHQLDVIEYLQEENRVFKDRLGRRRIRFTDADRRRLARKARALGRKVLNELQTLVTPDTLLRWYREMLAFKWNYSHRRSPGRPRVMNTIAGLIVRVALENRSWGYTRIQGAIANLGHKVARGTIANILRANGIDPALSGETSTPRGRRFSELTGSAWRQQIFSPSRSARLGDW
jgi:hypothetical protein